MKKILALLVVTAMLTTTLFTFVGCGATTPETALSMGQWVTLIADSFGLQNYTEEKPYFSKVSNSDPTFSAFQAAAEWGIIASSDDISASTPVTWNDVLVSLVNAGEFLDADASREEKIEYAIQNFDPSIRVYWGDRYIKMKQAVPLLDIAQEQWANKTYTQKIEKAQFADTVTDHITDTDIEYVALENTVTSSSDALKSLKVGDVYTLPANATQSASINKVESIEIIDDQVIITNDESFTEDAVAPFIEEVKIQETSSPDFTKILGIYDENGDPINFEIEDTASADGMAAQFGQRKISNLTHTPDQSQPAITPLGIFDKVKGTLKFKVKEYAISLSTTKDDVSLELSKEISKATNRFRKQTQKIYVKTSIKDVELTRDVDYSWGVLHSATVKLDYNTTIEGGIKTEREGKIGGAVADGEQHSQSLAATLKQYKSALENLNKDIRDNKCQDEIYICKLSIADCFLASVDFIIKGKISAEGDIKIVVELDGSQGVEYKNGKFRYIKTKNIDVDFAAEATLEATISPGVEITLLREIALITITFDGGVGASVGMTAHLFDVEGHELYSAKTQLTLQDAQDLSNESLFTTPEEIEKFAKEKGGSWDAQKKGVTGNVTLHKGVCLEWKVYPIVRFGVDTKSLMGKLLKKCNLTISVEILGSKNTVLQGHIDFPNNINNALQSDSIKSGLAALLGINADCTYDYTPWDEAIEETEELEEKLPQTEHTEFVVSDHLTLSTMRVTISEGNSTQIAVHSLPKGYALKDLKAVSDDPKIAKVDAETGTVTGLKEGTTQIVVQTNDGKFRAFCAVSVTSDKKVDFNALPNSDKKALV